MNLKFRAWDKKNDLIKDVITIYLSENAVELHFQHGENPEYKQLHEVVLMQSTGLKDKNGVEIYEYSELDGAYEVIFKDLRYTLRHNQNNDIIDLYDYWRGKNGEIEVTREYTKV